MDIQSMYKAVKSFEDEVAARVPENLFVEYVIPILTGENKTNYIAVWEHLAGNVLNKMIVVDRKGDELFTLPALSTSPKTSAGERDSKTSIYEIMQGYESRSLVSPMYAMRYMDEQLKDKVLKNTYDYEQLLFIDEILVKYGKEPRISKDLTAAIKRLIVKKKAEEAGETVPDFDEEATASASDDIGSDL